SSPLLQMRLERTEIVQSLLQAWPHSVLHCNHPGSFSKTPERLGAFFRKSLLAEDHGIHDSDATSGKAPVPTQAQPNPGDARSWEPHKDRQSWVVDRPRCSLSYCTKTNRDCCKAPQFPHFFAHVMALLPSKKAVVPGTL